jgi:hypothetical protein
MTQKVPKIGDFRQVRTNLGSGGTSKMSKKCSPVIWSYRIGVLFGTFGVEHPKMFHVRTRIGLA